MAQFRRTKRRGASLLEFIIGLPIVLILLLAVMQFGLLQTNQQTLKMASRAGALVAANMQIDGSESVPDPEIVNAIDEVLYRGGILSSGESIVGVGEVQLNYNVYDPDTDTAISDEIYFISPCDPPPTTYPNYHYVQVTICIPAMRLTPNAMACFGIDYTDRDVVMTSLFRHERSRINPIIP